MLRTLLQAGSAADAATVLETTLGPLPARVVVRGTDILAATAGPFVGVDALLRLVLAKRGSVQQKPLPASLAALLTSTALGPVDSVLAEVDAQRAVLEGEAAAVGGFARVLTVRFAALAKLVEGLPDDVQRVARLADGTRDVVTVLAEADLAPLVTVRVLGKLVAAGVFAEVDGREASGTVDRSWQGRPSSAPTPAAPSTPPSTLEPSTFESSTPGSAMPSPVALSSSPIVDVRPPVTVNDTVALPAAVAHPRDAQSWLGDDEAFFAAAETPSSTSLSRTTVIVLLIVGAVLGGLLATQCGDDGDHRLSTSTVTRPSSAT